jgi:chromate transporter
MDSVLVELALLLATFSLLTLGDNAAVLGEMQREVVGRGWVTDEQFLTAFAFSRITPGPGSVIAVPIGYYAAGLQGALTALVASYGPTALLAFVMISLWSRVRDRPWLRALRTGMVPVTAGLVAGTTFSLGTKTADVPSLVLIGGAALLISRTKVPTAVVILCCAVAGAVVMRP